MTEGDPVVLARAAAQETGEGGPATAKYHELLRTWFASDGALGEHLGIELQSIARERVVMRLAYKTALTRGGGIFHGGTIMALADHAAGCVFNTDPRVVGERKTGLTTDFTASFLRAAAPGEALVAEATVLRRGRSITFIDVRVRGESSGKDLAVARTTYATVPVESLTRAK